MQGWVYYLLIKNDAKNEPFLHFLHPTESIAYALLFSSNQILNLSYFWYCEYWTDILVKHRSYLRNIPKCQGIYTPLSVIVTCELWWPWRGWWGCHTGHDTHRHHTSSPLPLHCHWALLCGKITHFVTAAATAALLLTHVPCCRHSEEPCSVYSVQQVRRWGQRARLSRWANIFSPNVKYIFLMLIYFCQEYWRWRTKLVALQTLQRSITWRWLFGYNLLH